MTPASTVLAVAALSSLQLVKRHYAERQKQQRTGHDPTWSSIHACLLEKRRIMADAACRRRAIIRSA
jgi:hypothetical protein